MHSIFFSLIWKHKIGSHINNDYFTFSVIKLIPYIFVIPCFHITTSFQNCHYKCWQNMQIWSALTDKLQVRMYDL